MCFIGLVPRKQKRHMERDFDGNTREMKEAAGKHARWWATKHLIDTCVIFP